MQEEKKRNAAGGAENIWFYSVQLGKSYNVLLLIMLVATCTTFFVAGRVILMHTFYKVSNDDFFMLENNFYS